VAVRRHPVAATAAIVSVPTAATTTTTKRCTGTAIISPLLQRSTSIRGIHIVILAVVVGGDDAAATASAAATAAAATDGGNQEKESQKNFEKEQATGQAIEAPKTPGNERTQDSGL
jgi:hypothetical protein